MSTDMLRRLTNCRLHGL